MTDHQPAPEAMELPPLPKPWTAASTIKCTACGAPYEPLRSLPMAAVAPTAFMRVPPHACKCGSTQFGGTVSYDSVNPCAYTADQMRDYARKAFSLALARQAPAPLSQAVPEGKPSAREAADALLEAGEEFWAAVGREDYKAQGAVQWLTCDGGAMVIFTRGEYKRTLLANIATLPGSTVLHFQEEGDEDEGIRELEALSHGEHPQPQAVAEDARDGERWRMLAKHWKSAQMRFHRKPNVPKSITLTIDFTQEAAGASEIEGFFDAAMSKEK